MNHVSPNPFVETFRAIDPDVRTIGDTKWWADAKGKLVPVTAIKPMDKLIDETVRKIMGYAVPLSEQVSRFKGHTFDDVASLMDLIAQDYGTSMGGKKGNITLMSFDGLLKVQVQVQDQIEFGPELQAAKLLVDECITEWGSKSGPEIQALVTRAFQVDKQGQINRAELFMLRRVQIDDMRWMRAMDAITDSIRIIGSKTYVRFYRREKHDGPWKAVTIDIAQA